MKFALRSTIDRVSRARGDKIIPGQVYHLLRAGFLEHEADWLVAAYPRYTPGDLVYPGGPFIRVLTWLWRDDANLAMDFLAGYLARVRMRSPMSPHNGPRTRFADLL